MYSGDRFLQVIDPTLPEEHQLACLHQAVQGGGGAADLIIDLLDGPGAYQAALA